MVIDAQGNMHDRAGQFAGHARSAPNGGLSMPADLDDHAAAALDVYGLTESDLPGFADAWQERFGVLDAPAPETLVAAVEALLGFTERAFESVAITNGARGEAIVIATLPLTAEDTEHLEEYPWDEVAGKTETHVFADLAAADRLRAAGSGSGARREWKRLHAERATMVAGQTPPWHLLADPDELAAAARSDQDARNAVFRVVPERTIRARAINTAFVALLTEGTELPADMLGANERISSAEVLGPDGKIGTNYSRDESLRPITPSMVKDTAARHTRASARWQEVSAAHNEAEKLPAGALRSFLLDERPERSYPVTEGTGRKARTVTRTYRPTSDLQTEYTSARDSFERATAEHQKLLLRLQTHDEQTRQREEALAAVQAQQATSSAHHWQQGWPGDVASIPAPAGTENPKMEAF